LLAQSPVRRREHLPETVGRVVDATDRDHATSQPLSNSSKETLMRTLLYRTIMASTILCQSMALVCIVSNAASAQTLPSQQTEQADADEDADAGSQQMVLTEKQIEGLLAAQKTISAIVEKIPQDEADTPNPKIQAELDKTAKKLGFKDYGEYDDVANNVLFILDGFDREKKTFVGHDVILKQQIAAINSDDKLQPKDKRDQIKDLKDKLKSIEPVKYPDNVTMVTKYYDKLSEIFNGDE
jgi:hypothetical protein